MLKIGINGLGRIGRAILRINAASDTFKIVAINDTNPSNENLKYMLKYDSTYGVFDKQLEADDNSITIDSNESIPIHHEEKISDVPWDIYSTDIVIDSSGINENLLFKNELKSKGVRHQIVTNAPDSNEIDKYVIMGVNENSLTKDSFLISSSICDASAVAPVVNVLNKKYGIKHGFLTTLHPWLSYQNLLDGPSRSFAYPGTIIDNFSLGRASLNAIIPKTTSAIRASAKVLDYLNDKFQSLSFRVPTSIVSTADITVKLDSDADKEEIIDLFKKEEQEQIRNIFLNNFDPLISTDFIKSKYSAIIDHRWTEINSSNYLKLVLWYDNEWGYSSRVVDLVKLLESK
tara:strand:- start:3947 stop:4984 length:1038 start_codon:yes stop_codon:yes gene_type:complete